MESERRNNQIITSINRSVSEAASVDELGAALNNQTEMLSKFKVRKILNRNVRNGFVQKCGRKCSLWDTDSGRKCPKRSKKAETPKTPPNRPPRREPNSQERRAREEYERHRLADTPRGIPRSANTRRAQQDERQARAVHYRPVDSRDRSIDRRRQPNATVVRNPAHNTFRSANTYRPRQVNLDLDETDDEIDDVKEINKDIG